MAKIYERLQSLKREEIDNLKQFVKEHGGRVEMTHQFCNDDGDDEYYYDDELMAVAWVRKQYSSNEYCEVVVHEIRLDENNTLWFTYSPQDGYETNSYTEWDVECISELDFMIGQLEYVQEELEAKYNNN